MQFTCPVCAAALDVADRFSGSTVTCGSCRSAIVCPVVSYQVVQPPPIVSPRTRRPSQPKSGKTIAVICVAAAIGLAAACLSVIVGASSAPQIDRDYFSVIECSYEVEAVLVASETFSDRLSRHPETAASSQPLIEAFIKRNTELSEKRLHRIERFQAKHAVTVADWKPKFLKKFPEKDLIYGEIRKVTREWAGLSASALAAGLAQRGLDLTVELGKRRPIPSRWEMQKACIEDGKEYVMRSIDAILSEAGKVALESRSVKKLRAKVMAR